MNWKERKVEMKKQNIRQDFEKANRAIQIELKCAKRLFGYTLNAYIYDGVFIQDNLIIYFKKWMWKVPVQLKQNDNVTNFYNGTLLIGKVGFQLKVNNMYLKRYQFIEKIGKSHSGSHRGRKCSNKGYS